MERKLKYFYKTQPTIYSFVWRFVIFSIFVAGLFIFQFSFQSAKSFIEHVSNIAEVPTGPWWSPVTWWNWGVYAYNMVKELIDVPERLQELMDVLYFLIFLLSYSLFFGIRKFSVCSFFEKDVLKGIAFLLLSILLFPILAPLYCVYAFFHLIIIFADGFDIFVLWRLLYMIFTTFAYGTAIYFITEKNVWLPIVLFLVPLIMRVVQIIKNHRSEEKKKLHIVLDLLLNVIIFPFGIIVMFKNMIVEIIDHQEPEQPTYDAVIF